ncbi:MAG TPA: STAS domain-containing protein [Solirubrobacteraceae bacterium]|jgi:anti-sigma B factor antagonist
MRSFYVLDEEVVLNESLGRVTVVRAGGEIDYAASPHLRERLSAAVKPDGPPLIIDLLGATFIDSTAIGVLVATATRMRELGSATAILCADPQILKIFQIVSLEDIVDVCESREQALESLASIV